MPGKEKRPATRRRRLGRFLLKLLGWFGIMLGICLVFAAIAGYVAYRNLTTIVNAGLRELSGPFPAEVGEIRLSEIGKVYLKDVKLGGVAGESLVTIDEVVASYEWRELSRERRFQAVAANGFHVFLNETTLDALAATGSSGGSASAGEDGGVPDLSFLGRVTDKLDIDDGEVSVSLPDVPETHFDFAVHAGALDFGAEQYLTEVPIEIVLKNLESRKGEFLAEADEFHLSLHVSSDLSRVEVGELKLAGPSVKITPDIWPDTARVAGAGSVLPAPEDLAEKTPLKDVAEASASRPAGLVILIDRVALEDLAVSLTGFDGTRPSVPVLPDVSLMAGFDWRDIAFSGNGWSSGEPLEFALRDLKIGAGENSLVKLSSIGVSFFLSELLEDQRLRSLTVDDLALSVDDDSAARVLSVLDQFSGAEVKEADAGPPGGNAVEDSPKVPAGSTDALENWSIDNLAIRGGSIRVDTRKLGDQVPRVSAGFSLTNEPGGERGVFKLAVSDVAVTAGRSREDSLFAAPAIEAVFQLQELLKENKLRQFHIESPTVNLKDGTAEWWFPAPEDPAVPEVAETNPPTTPAENSASPPASPDGAVGFSPWMVEDLSLTGGKLEVDARSLGFTSPRAEAKFAVTTQKPAAGKGGGAGSTGYTLRITDAIAFGPHADSPALGRAGEISAEVDLRRLFDEHRISRVLVKGASVRVGEDLTDLVSESEPAGQAAGPVAAAPEVSAEPEPEKTPDPAEPALGDAGWWVDNIEIVESRVELESPVPELSNVFFAVETHLKDVPLSMDNLFAQKELQKVELSSIDIRNPYLPELTVAFLPTIFVEFSLSGLARQEVEKIDILSPVLYVGEGLFWFVDYQRHFAGENEGEAFGLEGELPEEAPSTEGPGRDWKIKEINAYYGKLVIAPTGYPIGILPFPFSASTNLEKGEIALNLKIPEEQYVYSFSQLGLELELYGLRGEIAFNVPIQQESNNLWQYFEVDRAVWKQYEAENLSFGVTYDMNGIYGKFGGETYRGRVDGEFNYYLKETGKWDAWIAATEVDTEPITEVIAPDNFLMDGKISATLVSQGVGKELGETTGSFETLTPGTVKVTKLNEVMKELPEEWSNLQHELVTFLIENLKDFKFEKGDGEVYLKGRDGYLTLDLTGEQGERGLKVYFHDEREKKDGLANASGEAASKVSEEAKSE